jgi:hypothetical protein
LRQPCASRYVVATDPADADAIWITEVWDSEASHKASLSLPAVQAAIARGKPLIAGFGERFVMTPVGGIGLPSRRVGRTPEPSHPRSRKAQAGAAELGPHPPRRG